MTKIKNSRPTCAVSDTVAKNLRLDTLTNLIVDVQFEIFAGICATTDRIITIFAAIITFTKAWTS